MAPCRRVHFPEEGGIYPRRLWWASTHFYQQHTEIVVRFADLIEGTVFDLNVYFLITSEAQHFPTDFFLDICISFVHYPSVALFYS